VNELAHSLVRLLRLSVDLHLVLANITFDGSVSISIASSAYFLPNACATVGCEGLFSRDTVVAVSGAILREGHACVEVVAAWVLSKQSGQVLRISLVVAEIVVGFGY
jgi:hypothetical protein